MQRALTSSARLARQAPLKEGDAAPHLPARDRGPVPEEDRWELACAAAEQLEIAVTQMVGPGGGHGGDGQHGLAAWAYLGPRIEQRADFMGGELVASSESGAELPQARQGRRHDHGAALQPERVRRIRQPHALASSYVRFLAAYGLAGGFGPETAKPTRPRGAIHPRGRRRSSRQRGEAAAQVGPPSRRLSPTSSASTIYAFLSRHLPCLYIGYQEQPTAAWFSVLKMGLVGWADGPGWLGMLAGWVSPRADQSSWRTCSSACRRGEAQEVQLGLGSVVTIGK